LLSSDSFTGLRALLTPDARKPGGNSRRGRRATFGVEDAGRWSLLQTSAAVNGMAPEQQALSEDQLERLLMIYLRRWGVLFRQVLERETAPPPWRTLLHALKRLELRGTVRGGRFVAGIGGEQFALPEAVAALRESGKRVSAVSQDNWNESKYIGLSATDPVNLLTVFLPEQKPGRSGRNRVLFKDGVPIAVLESDKVRFLREVPEQYQWQIQQLLMRRDTPPQLRRYLGSR
jgi:ATP-dependent Lhr-like helicase